MTRLLSIAIVMAVLVHVAWGDESAKSSLPNPIRAWFQPAHFDPALGIYKSVNMVTSYINRDVAVAETWQRRGVVPLRWTYGPQSEYSGGNPSYYRDQCDPSVGGSSFIFSGISVDEWNPGSPRYKTECTIAAAGFREARKRWPHNIMAAWVTTPDDLFISLLKDGTFDIAIIEGYTLIPNGGGVSLQTIRDRCATLKRAGVLKNAIVCYGFVSNKADKFGRRMDINQLAAMMQTIKSEFPEMPGVAFYGYNDGDEGTLSLISAAEKLALELYPDR